jgi:hypothetical protein
MMIALPLDMTSTLAPFGWTAAAIVSAGFAALLVAALRAGRPRRASADGTAAAAGGAPRAARLAA